MLDNRYALLFIRGERPVMDYKLDLIKHKHIKLTKDGGMMPYLHGAVTEAAGTISTIGFYPGDEKDRSSQLQEHETQDQFELLSEEELLEQYQEEGELN